MSEREGGVIDLRRGSSVLQLSCLGEGGSVRLLHSVTAASGLFHVSGVHLRQSVLPTSFSLLGSKRTEVPEAQDGSTPLIRHLSAIALERHPQPYHEHLWTLEALAEHFHHSGIDPCHLEASTGLSSAAACALLVEVGHNVLTPPARVPQYVSLAISLPLSLSRRNAVRLPN